MPLLRYFVFVGGALLALLLVADAVLPRVALPSDLTAASDLPAVRIRSQQKWPERVVIDTSIPLPAPVKIAAAPPQSGTADASAKADVREAFAQIPPGQSGKTQSEQKQSATKVAATEPGKAQVKPQPRRKVARARPVGRPMMMAQQPRYGLFASTWW
jgi:hypothetical protein